MIGTTWCSVTLRIDRRGFAPAVEIFHPDKPGELFRNEIDVVKRAWLVP
jgi:hypothetical protein